MFRGKLNIWVKCSLGAHKPNPDNFSSLPEGSFALRLPRDVSITRVLTSSAEFAP